MSRSEIRYFGPKQTKNIPAGICKFCNKVVKFNNFVVNLGNFLYRISLLAGTSIPLWMGRAQYGKRGQHPVAAKLGNKKLRGLNIWADTSVTFTTSRNGLCLAHWAQLLCSRQPAFIIVIVVKRVSVSLIKWDVQERGKNQLSPERR